MRIRAFKCEVCKSLSETEHKFTINPSDTRFEVWMRTYIPEHADSVCSPECVKAALAAWLATNGKPTVEDEEIAAAGEIINPAGISRP